MGQKVSQVTLTTAGVSAPFPLDFQGASFTAGIQVVINTGPATYSVQGTLDDVQASGYNPATGTWWTVTGFTSGSANLQANTGVNTQLFTAVRLNVSVLNAGSVVMNIIQSSGLAA